SKTCATTVSARSPPPRPTITSGNTSSPISAANGKAARMRNAECGIEGNSHDVSQFLIRFPAFSCRRKSMMAILDRQMILSYLKAYLICLVSLLSLYIVVDLFTNIEDFTQN